MFRVIVAWYVAPTIMLMFAAYVLSRHYNDYVTALITIGKKAPLTGIDRVLNYFQYLFHAYVWVFGESWGRVIQAIDWHSTRFWAGSLITVVSMVSVWLVFRSQASRTPSPTSAPPVAGADRSTPADAHPVSPATIDADWQWTIIGLVIVGLGYAIYAYLPSHQLYTERVFDLSMLGGAILLPILCGWLGRLIKRENLTVILLVSILAGLAFQGDLVGTERVATASQQEQHVLAQVVSKAPETGAARLLLILDPTEQFSTSILFGQYQYQGVVESAFQYMYHNPVLHVRVCNNGVAFQNVHQNVCTLTARSVDFPAEPGNPAVSYPLNSVIAFEYTGETNLSLLTTWPIDNATDYQPTMLIGTAPHLPARTSTMFTSWPFVMQTPINEYPVQSFYFEGSQSVVFQDAVSMPMPNFGWFQNFSISSRSALLIWLDPHNDYTIKIQLAAGTLPAVIQRLRLAVNDQAIALTEQINADQTTTLSGSIPRRAVALDSSQTRITLLSAPEQSVTSQPTTPNAGYDLDALVIAPLAN